MNSVSFCAKAPIPRYKINTAGAKEFYKPGELPGIEKKVSAEISNEDMRKITKEYYAPPFALVKDGKDIQPRKGNGNVNINPHKGPSENFIG